MQTRQQNIAALVATAKDMLDGGSLLEGCRTIRLLCHQIGEHNNPIFNTILVVESDTDQYPVDDVRAKYDKSFLQQLDKELAEYMQSAGPSILNACRKIAAAFDPNGNPVENREGT